MSLYHPVVQPFSPGLFPSDDYVFDLSNHGITLRLEDSTTRLIKRPAKGFNDFIKLRPQAVYVLNESKVTEVLFQYVDYEKSGDGYILRSYRDDRNPALFYVDNEMATIEIVKKHRHAFPSPPVTLSSRTDKEDPPVTFSERTGDGTMGTHKFKYAGIHSTPERGTFFEPNHVEEGASTK